MRLGSLDGPLLRSPHLRFFRSAVQCSEARLLAVPIRSRHLGTAFHSPPTTALLQATIERSTFPAYPFGVLPALITPVRPVAPPPDPVCPGPGSFHATHPLRNFGSAIAGVFRASTPLQGSFVPFQIEAFSPNPACQAHLCKWPVFPSLPANALLEIVLLADQRSRFATTRQIHCSMNLLEPST
jgi:hypothetical protein